MSEFLKSLIQKLSGGYLTDSEVNVGISQTREISTPDSRETRLPTPEGAADGGQVTSKKPAADSLACPYCGSTKFVRRGLRAKKHEKVQLYLCKSCRKTFTPQITKGKHYPLAVMLDAISIYNLGYSLEETCRIVNFRTNKKALVAEGSFDSAEVSEKLPGLSTGFKASIANAASLSSGKLGSRGRDLHPYLPVDKKDSPLHDLPRHTAPSKFILTHINLQPSTLANWIEETEPLCRYCQMRPYVMQKYAPKDTVIHATLAHRQLYRYLYHRGKCELLINHEYRHRRFTPLREFLEMVPGECPHQYFQEGLRASETPLAFSKTAMIVRGKQNYATRLAEFVLQSVKDRRLRHQALQKFMLANDSVTVAAEVPVYIMRDDIEHMKTQLGFQIFNREIRKLRPAADIDRDLSAKSLPKADATAAAADIAEIVKLPKLITGHIDILQIRNGMVHILDYKPRAEKARPIEQLTLYAMALSRLTGLRLFEFKCAWFDEKDYFEFYPLHVLHKPKKAQRRRKVGTKEGVYLVNKNEKKIEQVRPI